MIHDVGDSYELNMSYRSGVRFLKQRAKQIADRVGVSVVMEPLFGMGDGGTDDYIGGDGCMHIGIYDRSAGIVRFVSARKLSDRLFIAGLVACHHEGRHAELWKSYQQTGEIVPLEKVYAHLSQQNNRRYYKSDDNRYKYTTEIDAEFQGVVHAYEDLCDLCVCDNIPCDPETLICDFVNYMCENESYYIKQPGGKRFTSIEEIETAFLDSYEKATDHEPVQRVNGFVKDENNYRLFKNGWHGDEAVDFLVDERGFDRPGMSFFKNAIWDAGNYDKDKMISCIAMYCHPDYAKFYKCDVGDLSPESVFGKPFPESCLRFVSRSGRMADADMLLSIIDDGEDRVIDYHV